MGGGVFTKLTVQNTSLLTPISSLEIPISPLPLTLIIYLGVSKTNFRFNNLLEDSQNSLKAVILTVIAKGIKAWSRVQNISKCGLPAVLSHWNHGECYFPQQWCGRKHIECHQPGKLTQPLVSREFIEALSCRHGW